MQEVYYYQCKNRRNPRNTNGLWSESTVKDIIRNEAYIGNLVCGKSGTVSYKNPKQIPKPQDKWIRVQGTHGPIVGKTLWDRVQAFTHKKYIQRRRKTGELNLFTGLLYCSDCGFKLRGHQERRKRKDGSEYRFASYMCGTYAHSGKDACSIHSVNEKALCDLIAREIRARAQYDESRIIEAVLSAQRGGEMSYRAAYENELSARQKQIDKLDLLIENLYNDKVTGLVPDSMFKRQIKKYEQNRAEHQKSVKELEKRLRNIKQNSRNVSAWIDYVKQYIKIEKLDREILHTLIEKIIVGEPQLINGKRVCDVTVIYNFSGDAGSNHVRFS